MQPGRNTQDEHIALLQNGENGSQDFDEEYLHHPGGIYYHTILRVILLIHYMHAAQHPNDSGQHGIGPNLAHRS